MPASEEGEHPMSELRNVTPAEAFEALRTDPDAELVDVRTMPELMFVGFPDLGAAGKQLHAVEWQQFPAMAVNPGFVEALRAKGLGPEKHLYFLCRSGVRSVAAGNAALAAGQAAAFNILDGFEGAVDPEGHRGTTAGWKVSGLPWRQR